VQELSLQINFCVATCFGRYISQSNKNLHTPFLMKHYTNILAKLENNFLLMIIHIAL